MFILLILLIFHHRHVAHFAHFAHFCSFFLKLVLRVLRVLRGGFSHAHAYIIPLFYVTRTATGCLGALLEEAARAEGVLIPASSSSGAAVRADGKTIESITANNTKGTVEVSDDGAIIDPGRGEGTVNGDAAGEGEGDSNREGDGGDDDYDDNHPTRIRMPSGAWMPYDVMVGVSIGGGTGSSARRFWGLRGSADAGDGRRLADGEGGGEGRENGEDSEDGEGVGEEVGGADGAGATAAAAAVLGGNSSVVAANGTRRVKLTGWTFNRLFPCLVNNVFLSWE